MSTTLSSSALHAPANQGTPVALEGAAVAERRRDASSPWLKALMRLARRLTVGRLTLQLPDGRQVEIAGERERERHALVRIHRARAARRLLLGGDLAFAEAYLDGDWDTPDLPALLELATRNDAQLTAATDGLSLSRAFYRLSHLLRGNTRRGSRRNIAYHYDLSNAFYRRWLDEGMTYSSAKFTRPDQDLGEAQRAKYRSLIRLLELRPGHEVLEIGCGWGGFAELAAGEHGCRVTGLTLSQAQADFARERLAAAGLKERVDIRLQDYRDVKERYDRIASIEMFEAVGERFWPKYFATIRRCLKPGGIAGLQVITIAEDRFRRYRGRADFIQHYIFPGGMLPSLSALERVTAAAGLRIARIETFGASYARTLAEWQRRFQAAWPEIRTLGFGPRFKRVWEYYLAYCEAGFRAGSIDVAQLRLEPIDGQAAAG